VTAPARRWAPAWIAAGVVFVIALRMPGVSLPASSAGLRRFQIDINSATSVSQTFVMTADGLEAIEVATAGTPPTATGNVRLELYDVSDGASFIHGTDVRAADLVAAPVFRFEFQPIDDSAGQTYRFDLHPSELSPVAGVAVWATKGERYRGGSMLINDRERWADLAFAAVAPAGRSSWDRLRDGSDGASPAALTIVAFAGYWAALGVVLRLFAGVR
jgi:hypothetical protein